MEVEGHGGELASPLDDGDSRERGRRRTTLVLMRKRKPLRQLARESPCRSWLGPERALYVVEGQCRMLRARGGRVRGTWRRRCAAVEPRSATDVRGAGPPVGKVRLLYPAEGAIPSGLLA